MREDCPSDLELERLTRGSGGVGTHVLGCQRCTARMAELRGLGEEFEREVFPATVDKIVASSRVGRRPVRPVLWAAPALLALAAILVLVLRVPGPPDDYLGVKGPRLSLVAYTLGPQGARALSDGEQVPAGAGLRFEVQPARSCNLFVASTDANGQVSRIFPPDGKEGLPVKAGGTVAIPGGARLDGRAGPERFFAVCGCGDKPVTWADVTKAASAVGQGAAHVREARALPGLPDDALQATLLVEKRP